MPTVSKVCATVLMLAVLVSPSGMAATYPESVTMAGTSASGWSDPTSALTSAGSASTSTDGASLTISGFTGGASGPIQDVLLRVDASQAGHVDDELSVSASASGCASVSASPTSFEPSATRQTYAITLTCASGWTWSALSALSVSLHAEERGGLLLLSGLDGTWHVHHVRVDVDHLDNAPIAEAGDDQVAAEGSGVALAGSGSDADGDAVDYTWTQLSGPGVVLSSSATASPTFTAPTLSSNDDALLVFQLRVDAGGRQDTDSVQVTVTNVNGVPSADAGPDQSISVGDVVQLSGSAGDPDGDTVSRAWSQTAGPAVTLSSMTSASPTFQAVEAGTYVFVLQVNDGHGGLGQDSVSVAVAASSSSTGGSTGTTSGGSTGTASGGSTGTTSDSGGSTGTASGGSTSGSTGAPSTAGDTSTAAEAPSLTDAASGTAGRAASETDPATDSPRFTVEPASVQVEPGGTASVKASFQIGDLSIPVACDWNDADSGGTVAQDGATACAGTFTAGPATGHSFTLTATTVHGGIPYAATARVSIHLAAQVESVEDGKTRCASTLPEGGQVPVRFPEECGISLVLVDVAQGTPVHVEAVRSDAWPETAPGGDSRLIYDPVSFHIRDGDGAPVHGQVTVYYELSEGWQAECDGPCVPVLYRYQDGRWESEAMQAGSPWAAQVPDGTWMAVATMPVPAKESGFPWWALGAGTGLLAMGTVLVARRRRPKPSSRTSTPDAAASSTEHPARPNIVLNDLEAALRNDELIQFMNNASHDLASPLTPIRIQLSLLNKVHGDGMSPEQKRALAVVKRNVEHMGLLVTDLRDASRLQAGRLELFPQRMDLAACARAACDSFEAPCGEKGIRLRFDDKAGPVHVDGDDGRLTQVFYNLINNALKFTDQGSIQVSIRDTEDGRAIVTVRDTGLGMTPADAARLFKPFSQAHSNTEKKKGSGLGLFICKGIIDGHGGDIWCQSEGPGKGSVFAFTLPLASS